jgi:hypothetical protein
MAKKSLKERLKDRRKKIEDRNSSGNIFFPKGGTTRFRVLPVGEDEEFGMPVQRTYFGKGIKSFTSAATFGEECPVQEAYKEAKADGDADLAKKLSLRTKYLVPAILYKDERGKEVDTENSPTLIQVTGSIYGEMIDCFLDPDLGDFTDPEEGYDFKIKRTGSGLTDTKYSITPQRPSKLPKQFNKEVDLEAMVRKTTVEYSEAEELLQEFLESIDLSDEENDTPAPSVKKAKKVKKVSKKKKSK